MAVTLRLDDSQVSAEDYQRQWRRFWAAVNLLQYLPEFMPVSRSGIEAQVYAPIIEDSAVFSGDVSMVVADKTDELAWHAMLEFTTEQAALSSLASHQIPPPDDVGCDIQDSDDVVIASLEWCWAEQRIGLLLNGAEKERAALKKAEWRVVTGVEHESLEQLVSWLSRG